MGRSNLKASASGSPTSSSSHGSANINPSPAPPLPSISKIPPRPSVIVHENPNPTTFIQADRSSFKHVVQMLTGHPVSSSAGAARKPSVNPPARSNPHTFKKSSSFGLYQRRHNSETLRKLMLSDSTLVVPGSSSLASPLASLSPSSLIDITTLSLSPVTPLVPDPFFSSAAAEKKAIAEKGFYLHPSPRGIESVEPPRLLPLFPVTSPRVSSPSPS